MTYSRDLSNHYPDKEQTTHYCPHDSALEPDAKTSAIMYDFGYSRSVASFKTISPTYRHSQIGGPCGLLQEGTDQGREAREVPHPEERDNHLHRLHVPLHLLQLHG